jgi:predicted membrane channel-forming protein YqfA (hemolysin III family)
MKKITFKYWLTNILIGIMLFIAYRVVIAESNVGDDGFLGSIIQILDAFLSISYSFVYLLAIVFCSLTIFLNQIDRIRNNNFLSLLTFVGLPFCCVIFIAVVWISDGLHVVNSANNLLIFSAVYLVFCAIQFSFFRKRVEKLKADR